MCMYIYGIKVKIYHRRDFYILGTRTDLVCLYALIFFCRNFLKFDRNKLLTISKAIFTQFFPKTVGKLITEKIF